MTKEEAIKWLENLESDIGKMQFRALWDYKQAIDEIIDLLSADSEWIPCSERLPKEGEVVLTQAKFKDDIKMAVSSRVDYNYWTGWMTREINIVAWMPLPKPYGERREP